MAQARRGALAAALVLAFTFAPPEASASQCVEGCDVFRIDSVVVTIEPALDCLDVDFSFQACNCDVSLRLANTCASVVELEGFQVNCSSQTGGCDALPPQGGGTHFVERDDFDEIDGETTFPILYEGQSHTIRVTYDVGRREAGAGEREAGVGEEEPSCALAPGSREARPLFLPFGLALAGLAALLRRRGTDRLGCRQAAGVLPPGGPRPGGCRTDGRPVLDAEGRYASPGRCGRSGLGGRAARRRRAH